MIHHAFIPEQERIILNREYRARALIILCLVLAVAFVIGAVSLLPTYIHARNAAGRNADLVSTAQNNPPTIGISVMADELNADRTLLSAISSTANGIRQSVVISAIIALRGDNTITSFSLDTASSTISVSVEGIAPSRDGLVLFKDNIEKSRPGLKVDLPVSQLANSKDIKFSFKINGPWQ